MIEITFDDGNPSSRIHSDELELKLIGDISGVGVYVPKNTNLTLYCRFTSSVAIIKPIYLSHKNRVYYFDKETKWYLAEKYLRHGCPND